MNNQPDVAYQRQLEHEQAQVAVQANPPPAPQKHFPRIEPDAWDRASQAAMEKARDLEKRVWESQLSFKERMINGEAGYWDLPARKRFASMARHEPLYEPAYMGKIRDLLYQAEVTATEQGYAMQVEQGMADPSMPPQMPERAGYAAGLSGDELLLAGGEAAFNLAMDPAMQAMVPSEWLQKLVDINQRETADRLDDYGKLAVTYGRAS